jgi:hypothetical protein
MLNEELRSTQGLGRAGGYHLSIKCCATIIAERIQIKFYWFQ